MWRGKSGEIREKFYSIVLWKKWKVERYLAPFINPSQTSLKSSNNQGSGGGQKKNERANNGE
jgi:hypothetical protein